MNPKIRPGIGVALDQEDRLHFILYTQSKHVIFEVEPPVVSLISLLTGQYTYTEILKRIQGEYPDFQINDLSEVITSLVQENLVYDAAYVPDVALSVEARDRYSRQLDFLHEFATPEVNPLDFQVRIRDSRVAIVGVGGTGTWMVQSLVLAGVGAITIIDSDKVELSNLNRQVLFGVQDVGRYKVDAVEDWAYRLGSAVKLKKHKVIIDGETNLKTLFQNCDLVINCADQPSLSKVSSWIGKACMSMGIPHIVGGGYSGHLGAIGPTIIPYRTACWECFLIDDARRPDDSKDLNHLIGQDGNGTFGLLSALITNLQAWDAIRLLTGLGEPLLTNRTGELNLSDLSMTWTSVEREENCPICGSVPGL